MNWNSAAEFLSMGGYGLYVWGSYGVTLAVAAIEVVLLVTHRRSLARQLRRIIRSKRKLSEGSSKT